MLNPNKPGYFITIEGMEGAGKSSVVRFIEKYLIEKGIAFVSTREFGGTEIAEKIRKVLLDHHGEIMCHDTEILLAFAARAQHLANLIIPSLEQGKWVICDRFTDATYAYQGAGRGVPVERIASIETWVQGDLRPDFTLLLDLDAEIGLERVKKARALDRIEAEKIDFFRRVRDCYLNLAKQYPQRYRIIDASCSLEKVAAAATRILDDIQGQVLTPDAH
jgi:dTMP kinase